MLSLFCPCCPPAGSPDSQALPVLLFPQFKDPRAGLGTQAQARGHRNSAVLAWITALDTGLRTVITVAFSWPAVGHASPTIAAHYLPHPTVVLPLKPLRFPCPNIGAHHLIGLPGAVETSPVCTCVATSGPTLPFSLKLRVPPPRPALHTPHPHTHSVCGLQQPWRPALCSEPPRHF